MGFFTAIQFRRSPTVHLFGLWSRLGWKSFREAGRAHGFGLAAAFAEVTTMESLRYKEFCCVFRECMACANGPSQRCTIPTI